MPVEPTRAHIDMRAFAAEDRESLARIGPRIRPAEPASPRDPAALNPFSHEIERGRLLTEPVL
jgi:hypothetical protein